MGVGDGVGLWSRPRSRSSSACAEFNSKNVVLPTSSRNSRLYARLKTGRRDEYVQKHCDLQDKKHENTIHILLVFFYLALTLYYIFSITILLLFLVFV